MIFSVILGGGIGTRMKGSTIPKQFIKIGSYPIIVYSIRKFLSNHSITEHYVVLPNKWFNFGIDLISRYFDEEELKKINFIKGGPERIDSLLNCINAISNKYSLNGDDILICHDAVRPFVTDEMIDNCIASTKKNDFSLVCVSTNDTVYVKNDNNKITGSLDRSKLLCGQTPSGFNLVKLIKIISEMNTEEKKTFTGTTQLVLKNEYVDIVDGDFSNFKITTPSDINIANEILSGKKPERKIELLECKLRDGGIVLSFDFGIEKIREIISALEKSHVNIIEVGYINSSSNYYKGMTSFSSDVAIRTDVLEKKKKGISYVAMIDHGKFDVSKLENRNEKGIDGIRYAFHKENWKEAIEQCEIILKKGYDLYIQPMVTIRYSDEEFTQLINACNKKLKQAKAFTIVDSFGQLDSRLLIDRISMADELLIKSFKLGFHAHNNRQMAFSNSIVFIEQNINRDIIVDSSVFGMGKGPGNVCTELIMEALNSSGSNYNVTCIYKIINSYSSHQIKKTPWGYCLNYYLSSLYGCTPSYVNYFEKNASISIDNLIRLLNAIPESSKCAFDEKIAKELLRKK